MSHKRFSQRVMLAIVCLLAFSLFLAMSAETSSRGQEEDKVIEKRDFWNPPVQIKAVKSRIGDIELGKKIETDDSDWLKGLKVRVHNVSGKTVKFVMVRVWFVRPESQAKELDFVVHLEYGPNPFFPTPPGAPVDPPIASGETAEVAFHDVSYDSLLPLLSEVNLQIRKVRVLVEMIEFTDGTSWQTGRLFKRDPDNPEKWVPLNEPQAGRRGNARADPSFFRKALYNAHSPPRQVADCGVASSYVNLHCSSSVSTNCTYPNQTVLAGDPADSKIRAYQESCVDRSFGSQTFCRYVTSSFAVACSAPDPTPTPVPKICSPSSWYALACQAMGGAWNYVACQCEQTPVVVDVSGNGFDLTDAQGGVSFDIDKDGTQDHIAWTGAGSDDAWLVLDRNNNGTIDDGSELFGNVTSQPPSDAPNGFLALAEYDKPENGGNGDGVISSQDAIFSQLRLWQDVNHNGVSESAELHPLTQSGVAKLELNYTESRKTDSYGNRFRYRAKVMNAKGEQTGRWAWDVFLTTQ